MYHSLDEFFKEFNNERQATQKIFDALTDASLAQAVAKDHRTIGRMAWHIITTYPEMSGSAGIPFASVDKDAPVPASASAIAKAYKDLTQEMVDFIKKNWKDADLAVEKDFYGEKWSMATMLAILIRHEIHHRGQLTVLMRQAGVKVPGIYGPAMEEWSNYGQPAPAV